MTRHGLSLSLFLLLALASWPVLAAEPMPDPFVRLMVNDTEYAPGATITARPGERLVIKAEVYGGRRAWCMEPLRYANVGRNTVIIRNSDQGMEFSTGEQFRGTWRIGPETAAWYGQLNPDLTPRSQSNIADLVVPSDPGEYQLEVKATVVWNYDRQTPAGVTHESEENEATARYTVAVEGSDDLWLSLANVSARGDEDDDLRFRLNNVQALYDLISAHLMNNKLTLARSAVASLKETFEIIGRRLDTLRAERPGFSCTITLHGSPSDAAIRRLSDMESVAEAWKNSFTLISGELNTLNQHLLNTQMVFSANILKSVFKNYINWGSQLPNLNNLFGNVPWQLSPAVIPSDVLGWYADAQNDSSILADQARTIRMLSKLRTFYETRQEHCLEEFKTIKEIIRDYEPVREVAGEIETVLNGASWASRTNARQ